METPTPSAPPSHPVPSSTDSTFHWIYAVALVIALVVFSFGSFQVVHHGDFALLAAGVLSVLTVLVTWPIAASLAGGGSKTAEAERTMAIATLTDRLNKITALLSKISDQQLLSDRAKAVAFRGNDRQALRKAIDEEMNAKNWDAALVLANEMETQFGYVQEAATLRAEINSNRTEVVSRQIGDALAVIDDHVRLERWSPAMREAERILQIYPNEERAKALPQEIENRRQAHKKQLLDGWKDANARNDIDGSIEILKRVDPYLTPAEAASMQEAARGIFRERLNQMRDRFAHAVRDEKWSEALRLGELIMSEHPNSRLALEVRDTMDTLRQRAGKHAEVV